MKRLTFFIVVMLIVGLAYQIRTDAQDTGYDSYTFQANTLCDFKISLLAENITMPVNVTLKFEENIVERASLITGETLDLMLVRGDQWYTLIIEREEQDKGDYRIDSGMSCPPPVSDAYATVELDLFANFGWGPDDIQWFRDLYVNDPQGARDYIEVYSTSYAVLEDALTNQPWPTMAPSSVPTNVPIPTNATIPTIVPIPTSEPTLEISELGTQESQ